MLRAMGAPDVMGAVRFSLSRHTSEDEVARLEAVLPGILSELRSQGALGRR